MIDKIKFLNGNKNLVIVSETGFIEKTGVFNGRKFMVNRLTIKNIATKRIYTEDIIYKGVK